MSKQIILCEGPNDSLFLEQVLTEKLRIPKEKIHAFKQQPESLEKTKIKQTKKIEDFKNLYSNRKIAKCRILIKSEGGKDKAIACMLALPISDMHTLKPLVILDLDRKKPEKFIEEKVKKGLEERYRGSGISLKYSLLDEKDETRIYSLKLNRNESSTCELYLILFEVSLEHSAGMPERAKPDREARKAKICEYARNGSFHQLISQAIKH